MKYLVRTSINGQIVFSDEFDDFSEAHALANQKFEKALLIRVPEFRNFEVVIFEDDKVLTSQYYNAE